MPDAKVYANDRSILQAGDGLSQASATPDVCKTPGPSGPTPVPYPNVAHDSDLAQGSKSVRIGGKSVAIEGANLRTSTGDEAGTAGGGVFSNKIKGKLTWLGGSPNVSFEGKSVIRFGDTCLHNGNASNGGEQPNAGKLTPGSDKCGHGDLRRLEREFERAQREKERAKRRLDKAIAESRSERVIDELVEAWKGLIGRCNGLEWELLEGERGRLDRKFCNDNLSKDDMRGRIQEH